MAYYPFERSDVIIGATKNPRIKKDIIVFFLKVIHPMEFLVKEFCVCFSKTCCVLLLFPLALFPTYIVLIVHNFEKHPYLNRNQDLQ